MAFDGVEELTHPASLAEAWSQKEEGGDAARFIGGGIDLAVFAPPSIRRLIDLAGLGISSIREGDGGVRIGAMATMTEIEESPFLRSYVGGFLTSVLSRVASPLQRNLATFGGTIGSLHPWSDIVPALLVLDATVVVYDGEEHVVSVDDYLDRRAKGSRPLISEIRLPRIPGGATAEFEKFSRTRFDISVLNCACFVGLKDGKCETVRIAIGGRPGIAARLYDVEEEMKGEPLDGKTIGEIAALAARRSELGDDRRASAEYRRTLAEVGVKRCLGRVAGRLGGGKTR